MASSLVENDYWVVHKPQLVRLVAAHYIAPLGAILAKNSDTMDIGEALAKWRPSQSETPKTTKGDPLTLVFVALNHRRDRFHSIFLSGSGNLKTSSQIVNLLHKYNDPAGNYFASDNPLEFATLPQGDGTTAGPTLLFNAGVDPELAATPTADYHKLSLVQRCYLRERPVYTPFSFLDARAKEGRLFDLLLNLQEVLELPVMDYEPTQGPKFLGVLLVARAYETDASRPSFWPDGDGVWVMRGQAFRRAHRKAVEAIEGGSANAEQIVADAVSTQKLCDLLGDQAVRDAQAKLLAFWDDRLEPGIRQDNEIRFGTKLLDNLLEEHLTAYTHYLELDPFCISDMKKRWKTTKTF